MKYAQLSVINLHLLREVSAEFNTKRDDSITLAQFKGDSVNDILVICFLT